MRDYREVLSGILAKRKNKNSQYSLRSFSRDLGIAQGQLSAILAGKQGISNSRAENFCEKLGLSSYEKEVFLLSVKAMHDRSENIRQLSQDKLKTLIKDHFRRTERDLSHIFSEWFYFALLELTHLDQFESSTQWMSNFLKLPLAKVDQAVSKLLEYKFLKFVKGKLVDRYEDFSTTHDIPSKSIREYHQSILRQASLAIDEQDVKSRDVSSYLYAMSEEDISLVKEEIQNFHIRLSKLLKQKPEKNKLYCLNINFFDLERR